MRITVLMTVMTFFSLSSFAQMDTLKAKEVIPQRPPSDTAAKVEPATVNRELWRSHLMDALQPYMNAAVKNGVPPGTYVVQVKFRIGKDGKISEVSALNDPGYGMAEGAVSVVKHGPKWNPATQNGQNVASYRTQPITYVFTGQ